MTRAFGLSLALAAVLLRPAAAAPPAHALYAEALAHEQTVRAELASDGRTLETLRTVRNIVAEFESLVRHYPASGYSDNALWQAALLALDAYETFGHEGDRETAVRLLKALVASYPSSSLVARVPERLAKAVGGTVAPAPAVSKTIATIRDIRRDVLPDAVRITIELDAEVTFRDERIPGPERVFVDLSAARAAPSLLDRTLRFDSDAEPVRQVRLGRHPNNTTRVVLDAAGIVDYSVYPLYNPYRLVIDCVRPQAATAAVDETSGVLRSRPTVSELGLHPPERAPIAAESIDEAYEVLEVLAVRTASVVAPATPEEVPAPVPSAVIAPAKPLTGGVSIARQLGLNVSRIVIDPGHGGHDPGTEGKGITEAELVLDIALRLEKLLEAVPGTDVILTRRTDEFVALQERTAIANRMSADLFLSIHANSSPNRATRGVETYFLNFATNLSAARLAARENAASGEAMRELPDFVKAIALNNKLDESRDFATHVHKAMLDKLRGQAGIRDLGVKQAPFVVLIGAAMPSVLAEISFLSNTQDVKLLKTDDHRQRIAEALYGGVRKYQTSLNASAVAQRD